MFSRLRSYLTAWTRRDGFEESLDEEVRFHLDAYARDLVRSGVPAAEARRRARVQFGSVEGVKDGCRQARGLRLVDEAGHVMTNIRLALRMLLKAPVVTGVAVLSLALGIGSNTAIFSLYSQLVLRPLPVADPDGLVNLASPGPKPGPCFFDNAGTCDETFSFPMFRDLEHGQEVFTSLAAHKAWPIRAAPLRCGARRSRGRTSRPWACSPRRAGCSGPRSTGSSAAIPSSS